MTSIRNILRAAVLGVAVLAASAVPVQKAQAADRGDVIAGVAGGLFLGAILGTAAQASSQTYYAPSHTYTQPTYVQPTYSTQSTYYAPAPTYYAPAPRYYTRPATTFSFGYYGGRRYYGGHRHRYHRRHHRRHHRHHRRHGH